MAQGTPIRLKQWRDAIVSTSTSTSVDLDALADRVRGEYMEMPGLRLTVAQACRLWQLDRDTCQAVLDRLVESGALSLAANDTYVVASTGPRSARRTRRGALRRT